MSNINIPTQVSPFASLAQFPAIGKSRVIYIDQSANVAYYWNLSTLNYVSLGGGTSSVEWGDITGTLADQTDLQNALNDKVDKVTGKGLSTNDYTTAEKNKLAGIEAGAQVNVNADWNATTGDAEILNKPTIPTAVTKTSDLTNDGADGINPFITAGDIPTFASADKMVTVGRNSTGSTLYRGTIVYISGSTGNRPNFVKSQANSESTSAGTFGVIENDIPNNSDGNCVTMGTIDNLDTRSTAAHPFTNDTLVDGDTIYLSPTTAGFITRVKPYAPSHLVYIGKVVRTSPTNGTIVYRIQNGYELDEIHDVAAQTPSNNEVLSFESATTLWKPKSLTTLLGFTPENVANKSTSVVTDQASNTKYPSVKAVYDWAVGLFQTLLVSGTNIKTINGNSVLGSGDLVVGGGGGGIHALVKPVSGRRLTYGLTTASVTGSNFTVSRLMLVPFIPANTFTISEILMYSNIAQPASLCRLLIYSDNNGVPDAKLYESSNLDLSTTGFKIATTTFTFNAGTTYWLGFHGGLVTSNVTHYQVGNLYNFANSGTTPNSVNGYFVTAVLGLAPANIASPSFNVGSMPWIALTPA
jgi:hypothetical protein